MNDKINIKTKPNINYENKNTQDLGLKRNLVK